MSSDLKTRVLAMVRSLVDIRPGERRVAFLMFLYLFLVIATFAVVKPVRSSLFLQHFGARNLPYIYLATALLAGGTAWVHSRLLDRFHLVTVQVLTYLFFISNLLVFWFAFRSKSPWISAAFFLWVNIFTVTANTLFWMFANYYYNPREAKRLYGFINAGGTVGGIASGVAVSAVVRDVGTENMLLVCCGVLGLCILLTYGIQRSGGARFAPAGPGYVEEMKRTGKEAEKEQGGRLRALFYSAYPKYIAAALALSLVISTLIDYQFNVLVEQSYPGKDAKTAFFGRFEVALNLLAFVLQFFLTSPLLRGLGIGFALLLLPATLFGGSLLMLVYPGLLSAILLKVGDGSVRYSIEQSTRDVLYLPIPNQIMSKLKALVDVFVQRLAKGLGSVLILALTVWWAGGFKLLGYLSAALTLLWMGLALLLRREYREQLKNFLGRENLSEEGKFVRALDRTTKEELLKALESGDERTVLYCLELLEGTRNQELAPVLRKIVRQGPARLRARALHVLADLGDRLLIEEAQSFLRIDARETQEEAIHYLCGATSPADAAKKLREFLTAEDLTLRAAAMACMANCGGAEGMRMAEEMFQGMLAEEGEGRIATRRLLARTLGHIKPPSALHSYLRPLLQDASTQVVGESLAATRHVLRRDFVPLVVERLADPRLAPDALATLNVYGEKVLGTLRDCLDDETISLEARRRLPSVFVGAGTERGAQDLLGSLHQPDAQLRHEIIKALNKIKQRHPQLALSQAPVNDLLHEELGNAYRLLRQLYLHTSPSAQSESGDDQIAAVDSATEDYRRSIERIFRLLGLLVVQRDVYTAYRGLNSPRRDVRANAIELLETLSPPHLKKVLLPLVDDEIPIQEKLKIGESLVATSQAAVL